jgi:hypothetical protein
MEMRMTNDETARPRLRSPRFWPSARTNGLNTVTSPVSGTQQFYRLNWASDPNRLPHQFHCRHAVGPHRIYEIVWTLILTRATVVAVTEAAMPTTRRAGCWPPLSNPQCLHDRA